VKTYKLAQYEKALDSAVAELYSCSLPIGMKYTYEKKTDWMEKKTEELLEKAEQ